MNKTIYNIGLLVGIVLTSIGTSMLWGVGAGLLASGLLILALTLVGAALAGIKGN